MKADRQKSPDERQQRIKGGTSPETRADNNTDSRTRNPTVRVRALLHSLCQRARALEGAFAVARGADSGHLSVLTLFPVSRNVCARARFPNVCA